MVAGPRAGGVTVTLKMLIAERRADGADLGYRLIASQSFDTLNWRVLWLHRPPMRLSLKIACVVTILALLGIVAVAVNRHRLKEDTAVSQLYNEIASIAKGAPRIPASALGPLASADFMVVTNLRYLPSRVKESFCNVEDCNYVGIKFDMVNPGETMSTDYILPVVPNKRLVFAALNKASASPSPPITYASSDRFTIASGDPTSGPGLGCPRRRIESRPLNRFLPPSNPNGCLWTGISTTYLGYSSLSHSRSP
jgi:hypothetical protein